MVIEEACERLTFYPRFSKEVERYDHPGGMMGFSDTFPSRIGAWIDDLRKGTPPDEVDARAEDALKVQLAIESLIQSWQKGRVVKVPQR